MSKVEYQAILPFQGEFLDKRVPRKQRVKREEFTQFIGGILQHGDNRTILATSENFSIKGKAIETFIGIKGIDFTDGWIGEIYGKDAFIDEVRFFKNPTVEWNMKAHSSYTSSNMMGSWLVARDDPYNLSGNIRRYVSHEELEVLGDFLVNNAGIYLPVSATQMLN